MSIDYNWLVESRAKSQHLLLRLHTFVEQHATELEAKDADWSRLALLVGAAFSLWRAAFLSFDADRSPKTVINNARSFLKTLIQDNAINYPQDRATAAWTSGYYLNGARYRLDALLEKYAQAGLPIDHPEYIKFQNLHAAGIRGGDPMALWDQLYLATVAAFDQFADDWDSGTPRS